MTTVAALARDGHVWMAADSLTTVYDRPVTSMRKIRRYPARTGEALVGISGTGAIAAVLDADLKLAEVPEYEDLDDWGNDVARKASAICTSSGVAEEGQMAGLLLLGYQGRLWSVTHCYAIAHPDGVAAVGSGEGPAIGAIDTLLAVCPDMPPSEVVARAVQAAILRDRHSGEPVQIEHLPPLDE